jgi:hypothetical protein
MLRKTCGGAASRSACSAYDLRTLHIRESTLAGLLRNGHLHLQTHKAEPDERLSGKPRESSKSASLTQRRGARCGIVTCDFHRRPETASPRVHGITSGVSLSTKTRPNSRHHRLVDGYANPGLPRVSTMHMYSIPANHHSAIRYMGNLLAHVEVMSMRENLAPGTLGSEWWWSESRHSTP